MSLAGKELLKIGVCAQDVARGVQQPSAGSSPPATVCTTGEAGGLSAARAGRGGARGDAVRAHSETLLSTVTLPAPASSVPISSPASRPAASSPLATMGPIPPAAASAAAGLDGGVEVDDRGLLMGRSGRAGCTQVRAV